MKIDIEGNTGTFYQMGPGGIWETLLFQGKLKIGDIKYKDITKTGKLTWTCQELMYNMEDDTFVWHEGRLILDKTGNILKVTDPNGNQSYSLEKVIQ